MLAERIIVLIGMVISFSLFGYRVYQRLQHMRLGRPAGRFGDWGRRLKSLVVYFCGQLLLFRFPGTGTAHFFIFWGFLLLVPSILQAMIEGLFPGVALPFFGTFGPFLLVQDLIALTVVFAVLYGLYFRLVVKPERYRGSHQGEGVLVLCFILIIMVTLLGANGVRQNLGEAAILPAWQPVSTLVGRCLAGLPEHVQHIIERGCWWVHLGVVLVFLTLLPLGKHFHVVTSIFGVFLRNLDARGRLAPPVRDDGSEGIGRIEQFTWRQMLDWYTCSECGRCQDVCPAYASGANLSPKMLIMGLRSHLLERGLALRDGDGQSADREAVLNKRLAGDVIADETIWACTTCYACDHECPLFVEHIRPIVDIRRFLLTQQRADNQLTAALGNLRRYGNSFGKSDKQRAKWTTGLDFKIKDIRKQPARTLWFVGDYASYSPALTEATLATARVFQRAGIDFGLLYDAERNAGNDVRRTGEEGLFEMLAEKNAVGMSKCQFQEIVTTDPHTYNTLKNEYAWQGRDIPILHYSELIDRVIREGELPIRRKLDCAVTYHDPCYLGRYNNVYDPPRRVLEAIGCRLVEMPRNRDRALCCGAGGGRIWMDEGQVKERPSESRIREAAALHGVHAFVVTCPKDLTMYRDAVKTAGLEGTIVVKDLIELVEEATREETAVMPVEAAATNG